MSETFGVGVRDGAAVVRKAVGDSAKGGVRPLSSTDEEIPTSLVESMFTVHRLYGKQATLWKASPASTFVRGLCNFDFTLKTATRDLRAHVRASLPLMASAMRTFHVVSPGDPVLLDRIVSFGPSCCLVDLTATEATELVEVVGVLDSLNFVTLLGESLKTAFGSQLDPLVSDQHVAAVATLACYAVACHYAIQRDEVLLRSEMPFDRFFALLFEGNIPLGMLGDDQVVVLVSAANTAPATAQIA